MSPPDQNNCAVYGSASKPFTAECYTSFTVAFSREFNHSFSRHEFIKTKDLPASQPAEPPLSSIRAHRYAGKTYLYRSANVDMFA